MKKNFKRTLALLLTLFCLMPIISLSVSAATTLDLPVVYVAGKFHPIFNKEGKQIYPLDPPLSSVIMDNKEALVGAYTLSNTTGNWTYFSDKIYEIVEPLYRELKLDGNGEIANGSYIKQPGTPKAKASNYKLTDYMFTYDSRLDPYYNAGLLNTYIKKVLQVTGKSKVNLIGRCLGTTIVSTYLTKYGCSKVETAIFYASAFNGVQMMDDFFSGNFEFEANRITYYIAHGMKSEGDTYNLVNNFWTVLSALGLTGPGVNTANEVWGKMQDYLLPKLVRAVFGTWPGHWAMISADVYQKAKSVTFTNCMGEYAGLIKKTDKYQKEVMSVFPKTLESMMKNDGLRVAIFCKYNTPLAPLSDQSGQQADGTVELETMSLGATAAPIGTTFTSAYIRYLKQSSSKAKYLSPDLMVDASTCKYPDYTWFIRDVAHDAYPDEINDLFMDIFHSSTQYTINTNSKFPQFLAYDSSTKKISIITEPAVGSGGSGGGSSNFLTIVASYIVQFIAKLMNFFGLNKTTA